MRQGKRVVILLAMSVLTIRAFGQAPALAPEVAAKANECMKLSQDALAEGAEGPVDFAYLDFAHVHAALGDIPAAMKDVDRMRTSVVKLEALLNIAILQAQAGDAKGAAATVEMAKKVVAQDMPDTNFEIAEIVRVQAKMGDITAAKKTLEGMKSCSNKIDALVSIAEAQHAAKDFLAGKATLADAHALLKNVEIIPRTLQQLAACTAEAGDPATARQLADRADSPGEKAELLAGVADAQVKGGDAAGAKATVADAVAAIKSGEADVWRMPLIAGAALRAGDAAAAKELFARTRIAVKADDTGRTFDALFLIAEEQAKSGDKDAAKQSVTEAFAAVKAQADTGGMRTFLIWRVTDSLATFDPAAARDMIDYVMTQSRMDSSQTAMECGSVAKGIARSEGPTTDLAWIKKLETPAERALAYAGVAAGLVSKE